MNGCDDHGEGEDGDGDEIEDEAEDADGDEGGTEPQHDACTRSQTTAKHGPGGIEPGPWQGMREWDDCW